MTGAFFEQHPPNLAKLFVFVDLQLISLALLDICDYIKFEKNEKALLSSELLDLAKQLWTKNLFRFSKVTSKENKTFSLKDNERIYTD